MRYEKPWLSYEEQADKLLERGLVFKRDELIVRLQTVGYYRLSGYWYIFKQETSEGNETFAQGTSFDKVWDLYVFDRQLRRLVFDAIERVEVYMRVQLAHRLAELSGAFGYLNRETLPNLDGKMYGGFISRCFSAYGRSKTQFIDHFREKYGDSHGLPPYWALVNIMDFGMMLTLFRGSPDNVKKEIAAEFDVPAEVLESWLLTLNTVRNICAHHDRLWNRRLGNRLKIPRGRKYPEWHTPFDIDNGSTFALLTVLGYLVHIIAPESDWQAEIVQLVQNRGEDDLQRMGFQLHWQESPLWVDWM